MYLIYAVAKYERNGRIVDNFEKVRARRPPALEEGIEFVKAGREPLHESYAVHPATANLS